MKFMPVKSSGTRAGPSTIPNGLDPIATSSSLKPTPKSPLKSLPVKEALIDSHYHGGKEHRLLLTCDLKKGLFLMKQQHDSTESPELLFDIPLEQNPKLEVNVGREFDPTAS